MKELTNMRGWKMKTMKWGSGILLAVAFFFGSFASAHAEERLQCTITIEAGKHTFSNPAEATGVCKGYVWGYYVKNGNIEQFNLSGMVSATVEYNGQKFEVLPYPYSDYPPILTVYIVKNSNTTQPQPPKEEPKPQPPNPPQQPQPPKQEEPKQPSTGSSGNNSSTGTGSTKPSGTDTTKPSGTNTTIPSGGTGTGSTSSKSGTTTTQTSGSKSTSSPEAKSNNTKSGSGTVQNSPKGISHDSKTKTNPTNQETGGNSKATGKEKHETRKDKQTTEQAKETASVAEKKDRDAKEKEIKNIALGPADKEKLSESATEQPSNSFVPIVIGILSIAILALAGWFVWKRKMKSNESEGDEL